MIVQCNSQIYKNTYIRYHRAVHQSGSKDSYNHHSYSKQISFASLDAIDDEQCALLALDSLQATTSLTDGEAIL